MRSSDDKKFDEEIQELIKSKTMEGGFRPRPKKLEKLAVLPDGNTYNLYKSGKKWFVIRNKRFVPVHPRHG